MRRALLIACMAVLSGCYSVQWPWTTTELTTSGLADNPVKVTTTPGEAWYAIEPAQVSYYASDLTPEKLAAGGKLSGQVVNIEVIWEPKPGLTPLEPTTTNATIRLVLFAEGEVGVYGGGGFAWLRGKPEDGDMGLLLTGSNLSLIARTKGFVDLLTPAEMLGTVQGRMDEAKAHAIRRAASQAVTNALGSVRWVQAPTPAPVMAAAQD